MVAQNIDDRIFTIMFANLDRLIFDIRVLGFFRQCCDANGVTLIFLGQLCDPLGDSRRKQQGAPCVRRFIQDHFQIFGKAQIQHFIRLIQNDGADL